MKKSLSLKILAFTLILAMMPVGVFASSDINISVNGKNINIPKDQKPFIKDATSYLPLRLISTSLGKDIKWDGENKAIYIGRPPKNIKNQLTMEEFIEEYNVYSSGENYRDYLKGFENKLDRYEKAQGLKFNIEGKEVEVKNINLDGDIYPVYNEIAKVEYSLATSKDSQDLDGERIKLEGGVPRLKVLKMTDQGLEYKQLVSKLNYKVDEATKNQPVRFEMKLKDVYALGLPENAINVKFYRNTDRPSLYIDGEKFPITNSYGQVIEPININGRIFLPIRSLGQALDKNVAWDGKTRTVILNNETKETSGLTPGQVLTKYGRGDYERKIANSVDRKNVYIYNPRNAKTRNLKNISHIPDAEISLKGEFSTIRGYFATGVEVFDKSTKERLVAQLNSGTISSAGETIFEASEYFKATKTGEIIENSPNKARLKKYVPVNIVYFEIDVRGLDRIKMNNFNAMDLEFVK